MGRGRKGGGEIEKEKGRLREREGKADYLFEMIHKSLEGMVGSGHRRKIQFSLTLILHLQDAETHARTTHGL